MEVILVHNKDHSVEEIRVRNKNRSVVGCIADKVAADTVTVAVAYVAVVVVALVVPSSAVHLPVDKGRHGTV